MDTNRNNELRRMFVLNSSHALGLNFVQPLFPLFLAGLGASVLDTGFVVFASGALASFVMLFSGLACDKVGGKKLILATFMAESSILGCSLALRWEHAIPFAMIFACSFSLFMPARTTLVADWTSERNRNRVFSLLNITWPLGAVLGPSIAGLLIERYGWNVVFFVVALISIISLPLCLSLQDRKDMPENSVIHTTCTETVSLKRNAETKTNWLYFSRIIAIITMFGGIAVGSIATLMPLYLNSMLVMSTSDIGFFLSIGYGIGVTISQVSSAMFTSRFGEKNIFLLSLIMTPVFAFIMFFPLSLVVLLISYALFYLFWSLSWVSMPLLMNLTPSPKRGAAAGFREVGFRAGTTIGPLLGGMLWTLASPSTAFLVASFFLLACLPFFFLLQRLRKL